MHTCKQTCIHAKKHAHTQTNMRAHTKKTCAHTNKHAHTQTNMHTYTQTNMYILHAALS